MSKHRDGEKDKAGLPPGSLVYIGEAPQAGKPSMRLIAYGPDGVVENNQPTEEQIRNARASHPVVWVNVDGVGDPDTIREMGDLFGLHPLVQEDIMHTRQRPKLDSYDGFLYIVVRMVTARPEGVDSEQVSLVLGPGFLLTFQETAGDVFDPVRTRIRNGKGLLRGQGTDYLTYALLDCLVDQYFVVLEQYSDAADDMEDTLVSDPDPGLLHRLHRLKQELMQLRKSVWPLRDVIGTLERGDLPLISKGIRFYMRDLYDHTVRVIETVESLRDVISGMLDVYLSSVSNRMNEVMKVLTVISTIFIPITFLASIYGMNFSHMPELQTEYGYYGLLGVMGVIAITMAFYFRRKRWF
jgi:magnesium transporter